MEFFYLRNIIWILIFNLNFGIPLNHTHFRKNLPGRIIWAVLGKTAELPCDVTPPIPSDNVKMVFWFKDNIGMPWYSLDARSGLSQASHLTISGDLGNRLYFIMNEEPSKARLKIENVSVQDQGLYRCRVDFVNSPTRNFQVNLTLIEQPSTPEIFDAEGKEIKLNATAGPFLEGEELFLSCQVNGGNPRPSVSWWYGNTSLDSVIDTRSNSFTTVNQLFIRKVTRDLKGGKFECRATSSEMAGLIIRIIPILVYLKPNKVKIVTPNELMSNRKSQNIRCETSGSYPPAKLTWLLDGKPIKQSYVTGEETESYTASILTINVSQEDDEKELVCRADNTRFPGGTLKDKRRILVAYPPKVRVDIEPETKIPIKEGDKVKLKCVGKSRPAAFDYRWYQNGHLVHYNSTSGVFPMDESLLMRHIDRKSAGQYACSATNTEGETYSSPFDLQVQFTPRCRKGYEEIKIGTLPFKPIQTQCQVESVPEVKKFFWTYNTSSNVMGIQNSKIQNKGGISILNFEPPPEEEIKSLSCWAVNDLGPQTSPCVFHIIPAEIPEKPRNCFYRNSTEEEVLMQVICRPGKDGGLPQSFILEVNDVTSLNPINFQSPSVTTLSDQGVEETSPNYRVLGKRPEFILRNLKPGREYQVSVYAENAKGRSPSQEIMPSIKIPQLDITESGNSNKFKTQGSKAFTEGGVTNLTPIYVVLSSCAVILLIVIITSVSILACRKTSTEVTMRPKTSRNIKSLQDEDFELNSESGFGAGFHRRSAQYRASMYGPEEVESRITRIIDRPDLILSPRRLNNMDEDEIRNF